MQITISCLFFLILFFFTKQSQDPQIETISENETDEANDTVQSVQILDTIETFKWRKTLRIVYADGVNKSVLDNQSMILQPNAESFLITGKGLNVQIFCSYVFAPLNANQGTGLKITNCEKRSLPNLAIPTISTDIDELLNLLQSVDSIGEMKVGNQFFSQFYNITNTNMILFKEIDE